MNNFNISTLIKDLRIKHKYTIQNVANILGVSTASVSKWENGDDITTEHLYDLAKLYDVSFSELYNGKLNNENDIDYCKRNYDLSTFVVDDNITSKNIDNIKSLFEHCLIVKNRFFELLPKWANNQLSKNEIEEFLFLKKYFKFDLKYCEYKNTQSNYIIFINENTEKEFVNKTINLIKDFNEKKYLWEITKLYDFVYDYDSDKICKSGNLKALEYMLSSFSQIEKDFILYANLHIKEIKEENAIFGNSEIKRERTKEEIEKIPFFKIIINSGANVLCQYKSFTNVLDKNLFNKIEGKVVNIDNSIYKKYSFYNYDGQTNIQVLNNWKAFTYEEYLEFVDKDKTELLKDIVNIKNSNPKKYYENLKKRNNINGR